MGRVIHFEITADDVQRARKFYEIFDWNIEDAGMPGAEYWLAQTGKGGDGIDGAIMPRAYQSQPVIHWIAVEDLDTSIDKVKSAGGKIAGEKMAVPDIGDTVYAVDTEGNTFGMIEPLPRNP